MKVDVLELIGILRKEIEQMVINEAAECKKEMEILQRLEDMLQGRN